MSSVSANTKKQYEGKLRNLTKFFLESESKDLNLDDYSTTIQFLSTHPRFTNAETLKSYITAILYFTKGKDVYTHYHDFFNTAKEKCIEKAKQQLLPDNRAQNYLTKEELVECFTNCYGSFLADGLDYYDHLILALYIIQAPVRADYCGMFIVKDPEACQDYDDMDVNYCYLADKPEKDSFFVFNKYKTEKTYGRRVIAIDSQLYPILYAHAYERKEKFILPPFWSSNLLSHKVRNITKKYSGKECSIGLIRHAWVCDLFKNNPTIHEKEHLAFKMLHSVAVQELYRTTELLPELNLDE